MALFSRITSKEIARYVIKMSGLPVFLLGISVILTSLFLSNVDLFGLSTGLTLSAIGLGLRAEKAWLTPFAAVIALVWTVWRIIDFAPLLGVMLLFSVSALFVVIISLAIQIFLLAMTLNGLRGWFWLRRNGSIEDRFT